MPLVLRPYQEKIKADIYNEWDRGVKNVLLQLPTGMGKTKTFCSITIDLAVKAMKGYNLPTAIMVHRKELLQQISLTLAEEGIQHNIIAQKTTINGIIAAHRQLLRQSFYNYAANVTVVSVDTLNSRIMVHEKWAKSIKFWIVDEAAHVLKDNKWGRALESFPNAIYGLGVTATPERLDKKGLGSHADGVFDSMVVGPSTKWGIDNGFLSKYNIVIPESDYALYLKEANGDSDYTREAMAIASEKSKIVGDVVKNYLKFARGKQAIIFASDIGAGYRMEKEFTDAGVVAKILTGETPDTERLKCLIDYRDKKIQVLINVDLFDEGLDVPGIEMVGMARPTWSLSKCRQMIGRGLRPLKGKPYLILIDHVGNLKKHGLPDSYRKWSLNRGKKRKKNLNLIQFCKNPGPPPCGAPFDRTETVCPYCGYEVKRPARSNEGGRVTPEQVDGDLVLLDPDTLRQLEANTRLEDPASVAARVEYAAGEIAAKSAFKNQKARIETQKELAEVIAKWAGKLKYEGLTDRQINKKFFLDHETTIAEILAKPRADMLWWIAELESEL